MCAADYVRALIPTVRHCTETGMDIVIYEEDDLTRDLLRDWLAAAGYRVHIGMPCGKDVHCPAELVIVNVYMPKDAGAQCVHGIQAAHPNTPFIAISTQFRSGLSAEGATAQTLGVRQVIAKPLVRTHLLEAVRAIIGPADVDREQPRPRGNGQIIMIVDDEPPLVVLAEQIISQIGYEPVGFDSSTAALAAFRLDADRFDVLLTDEAMPELTGTELAQEVRKLRSAIPIILMTGYRGGNLMSRAADSGIRQVLCKPLRPRDLAESLAGVLGSRPLKV